MSIELENEIKRLKQENTLLKQENEDLKRKIEVLSKVPYDGSKPVSLYEYYAKKYLEMYEEAHISRIKKIDEEIIQLKEELSKLTNTENREEVIAKENEEIDKRIEEITKIIQENLMLNEELKFTLENHKKENGIIYAATRKDVEKIYEGLYKRGYSVSKYHAGLSQEERKIN